MFPAAKLQQVQQPTAPAPASQPAPRKKIRRAPDYNYGNAIAFVSEVVGYCFALVGLGALLFGVIALVNLSNNTGPVIPPDTPPHLQEFYINAHEAGKTIGYVVTLPYFGSALGSFFAALVLIGMSRLHRVAKDIAVNSYRID